MEKGPSSGHGETILTFGKGKQCLDYSGLIRKPQAT